jgi:hypothetical protein
MTFERISAQVSVEERSQLFDGQSQQLIERLTVAKTVPFTAATREHCTANRS